MYYKLIEEQILRMACNKIYKPLLLIAYFDYLNIMGNTASLDDMKVNIESLIPIIKYYMQSDLIRVSKFGIEDIDTIDNKKLLQIITTGPLFRIENEVTIFSTFKTGKTIKFGIATDNESIDISKLNDIVYHCCNQLIYNHIGNHLTLLNHQTYLKMVNDIKTTKIDTRGHPKIYKYLVLLAYIDYFTDLELTQSCFNIQVAVDDLFTYYKLYFNIPEFGDNIASSYIKDGSDKVVIRHMRELPIRKLCKPNTFFQCTQSSLKSRDLTNLPTHFGIIIEDELISKEIMIQIVRDCVMRVIQIRTNKIINTNLAMEIKFTEDGLKTANGRYGQSQYRKSLIEKYNCTCALCNMDLDYVLIASHAMPWRLCKTTHQRLSPNNGLLLCEYHDSLFDKGLITFDQDCDYSVIFSKQMTQTSIDHFYSFYDNKILKFVTESPKLATYLDFHRRKIFKGH